MAWTTFLSLAGFCFATCGFAAAVLAVQALRRWQSRYDVLESTVEALRREVELVASISAKTGRQVQRVEHDYSDVAERVEVVESRGPSIFGAGTLEQAIEWARRGADTDKLTEQFGLSSGEAELVARMHGKKKSA